MTIDTIKSIVTEAGGEKHILGFRFANGYKVVFSKHLLNLNEDFKVINGSEIFIFEQVDTFGNRAKSYLDVSEIVQVYTVVDIKSNICIREIME